MPARWIALPLLAALSAPVLAEPPTPLLWKVSDADNSVYLLGSFHLLRPDDYPLAPSVEAAYADAEHLVLELSPKDLSDPGLGLRMASAATRADGKTLQQVLPDEVWTDLAAYARRRGIPLQNLQGFEPWFVSLLVSVTEMQALGLASEQGLDRHFADRAVEGGKPARGLETPDQQIAIFDGMDERTQVQGLQDSLEEAADMGSRIEQLHAMWRRGDAEGLYRESTAELRDEYPALYKSINTDRNLSWLPRLQALLDDSDGDDSLVVVGALHLLGDDGVVALLRAKGYTVERL